jgi:3-oxoacyl-[acyl-carrier protein] reductase
MGRLDKKVAVVTGGGRGIGRSIARALAHEGADIAIIGRNSETLSDTESTIRAESVSNVVAVAGDVTRPDVVQAFGEAVRRDLGRVNILINNAAGWSLESFFEMDEDGLNEMIDPTIKGAIWVSRTFWDDLKQSQPGYIVNITTLGARFGRSNANPAYVAAKFGLAGLTDSLRRLAIKDSIWVTEILPGSVASEFDIETADSVIEAQHGSLRMPPREIAEAVVYAVTRTSSGMVEEIRVSSTGDWFEDYFHY